MTSEAEFFAPCPRGAESLLAEELRDLGCKRVRPVAAGVSFFGDASGDAAKPGLPAGSCLRSAYRALLWSRLASRVLLTMARVPATTADDLYAAVREIAWEDHVRASGTLAVDATGTNSGLRNTQFTAVRVKDAIADRFIERFGRRPNVDTVDPDLRVNVVVRGERATISIDLAGVPLHRRGYREPGVQVEAPMKETLAAALLAVAGWREISAAGGALVDPLCGSGTICVEAALISGDVAPGLTRTRWGFDRWLGHDPDAWGAIVADAEERRARGLAGMAPIFGFDADSRAVEIARGCVLRAGLDGTVAIERRELAKLEAPESGCRAAGAPTEVAPVGLVATNPPYGERIQASAGLPQLYAELADRLSAGFVGWRLAVITPDEELERGLGWHAERSAKLFNGRIESPVRVFAVPAAVRAASEPPAPESAPPPAAAPAASAPPAAAPAANAFANRLRKMARHYERWARKAGVTCYRVYDADLPDYAVAIDVYTGAGEDEGGRWVHIAEYAPPTEIDPRRARERLDDVLAVVPEVLGVADADVFLKVRERQRGARQYERAAGQSVTHVVSEGGLLFEVNFSDYLDTGLFLDHRLTREHVRGIAESTRFLNLFAYTGTASVYAAAGRAASTTTVDLSATYLEWARHNMARNGFAAETPSGRSAPPDAIGPGMASRAPDAPPAHTLVRADVLEWVREARAADVRYDLVFCDPPTFSNSKRMTETWDVQRDHVELVRGIADLLSDDGLIVFSCNRRNFAFGAAQLESMGLTCRDITSRTIPKDFERKPGVHVVWTVRRGGTR